MAELRVHHRWPDGRESSSYIPSNLVRKRLEEGATYPVPDFVARLGESLEAASLRVRDHFGHRCSIADADAAKLTAEAAEQDQAGEVTVLRLEAL